MQSYGELKAEIETVQQQMGLAEGGKGK